MLGSIRHNSLIKSGCIPSFFKDTHFLKKNGEIQILGINFGYIELKLKSFIRNTIAEFCKKAFLIRRITNLPFYIISTKIYLEFK